MFCYVTYYIWCSHVSHVQRISLLSLVPTAVLVRGGGFPTRSQNELFSLFHLLFFILTLFGFVPSDVIFSDMLIYRFLFFLLFCICHLGNFTISVHKKVRNLPSLLTLGDFGLRGYLPLLSSDCEAYLPLLSSDCEAYLPLLSSDCEAYLPLPSSDCEATYPSNLYPVDIRI